MDGRMIVRVMEYASRIAVGNVTEDGDGRFTMRLPHACVVYIRSTRNTPDKLTMNVEFPGGERVAYDMPLLKVREYTKDQLFTKDLLMLLPYYLVRYEKDCRAAGEVEDEGEADRRMGTFMRECRDVLDRLAEKCSAREQQYMLQTLADLIIEVAMYLAPEDRREEVRAMGGTVIRTRAQILREEGEAIGEARGELIGELNAKRATAEKLSKRGMPLDEIADIVEYGVDTVRQWLSGGVTTAR